MSLDEYSAQSKMWYLFKKMIFNLSGLIKNI